jgi:membrane-associated protease RseP (regulator of RpoE activity)
VDRIATIRRTVWQLRGSSEAHFVGVDAMRLIVLPLAGRFELCARLGLVFVPPGFDGGKIVHAVLAGSPSTLAGIEPRDIIVSVDGQPWHSVRHLTFSDRRPSDITTKTFVARYFTFAKIVVRVLPQPFRPLDEIAKEAAHVVAARQAPDTTPYRNPRFDDIRELLAPISRRSRRR